MGCRCTIKAAARASPRASGEFTNAVYGFASMMIKVWNDEKPDYIACSLR